VATPVSLPIFEQGGVNQRSPAQAKIALFRSLFHGREDVYPQRFESRKTGRVGYSPACGNEWVLGICEKPRIKCGRQHLGDPEAYRRDRRKDALLQENGYLALRFLAEDVGKCLDQVLDAILRALAHQNTRI
jgi:hypothetical protein